MNCDCQISVDWLCSPPAQPIDLGLLCQLGHRCLLSPHNYCSSGNAAYRSAGYTQCTPTHTYPDTLHRDAHPHRHTPSRAGSFVLNGKKEKTFRTLSAVWTCPRGWRGENKGVIVQDKNTALFERATTRDGRNWTAPEVWNGVCFCPHRSVCPWVCDSVWK